MSQFNFNMMDAAGYGFYRVWVERSYLLKLMLIPLIIKFACMISVMALGYEGNALRQGLIMFPGIIAEGWVLSQFLRTLLKNERWPTIIPPTIDDNLLDKLLYRARGIVAATIAYALIGLSAYFIRYVMFGIISGDFSSSSPATGEDISVLLNEAESGTGKGLHLSPAMLLPLMGITFAMFWAFRLMWIYIPLSVLMPIKDYLKALGGMMASVKMMVLYFCTMTPVMFLTVMLSRLVFTMADGLGEAGEGIGRFSVILIAVIAETLVALVSTAAFVYAMKDFLPKTTDLLKDLPKPSDKK
jgi:hypothetical protein